MMIDQFFRADIENMQIILNTVLQREQDDRLDSWSIMLICAYVCLRKGPVYGSWVCLASCSFRKMKLAI